MDRVSVFWVLAMNVIAMAVLCQRFGDMMHKSGLLEPLLSSPFLAPLLGTCGHLRAETFAVYSKHVVLPDGVREASGTAVQPSLAGQRRCGPSIALVGTPAAAAPDPLNRPRAAVIVKDGRIDAIKPGKVTDMLVLDYAEAVVSPGAIDVHAHLNEPGREEWEGKRPATPSAAHRPCRLVQLQRSCRHKKPAGRVKRCRLLGAI